MCESIQYRLKINESMNGQTFRLRTFPELELTYLEGKNALCPSNVRCFWEGDLTLKLRVNGEEIVLNDHDRRRKKESVVETDQYRYIFQGVSSSVENGSQDETYLIFTVERCPLVQRS